MLLQSKMYFEIIIKVQIETLNDKIRDTFTWDTFKRNAFKYVQQFSDCVWINKTIEVSL